MNGIDNWKSEIDSVTKGFKQSFADSTSEEMNYKATEESWSIAQIIAHIVLLNNSYFECFKEIQEGNHNSPTHENIESTAKSALISLMPFTSRDRLKRTNTWDIWQPPSGFIHRNVIQEFGESQHEFKRLIEGFDNSAISSGFIKYPGHLDLTFRLDDCISFLIEHEHRHLNQALEVGQHYGNTKTLPQP